MKHEFTGLRSILALPALALLVLAAQAAHALSQAYTVDIRPYSTTWTSRSSTSRVHACWS